MDRDSVKSNHSKSSPQKSIIGDHAIKNGIRPFPRLLIKEMTGRVFPLFIFAGHRVHFIQNKNKYRMKPFLGNNFGVS